MSRVTTSTSYIQPIKSDGTLPAAAPGTDATVNGHGVYTLEANTTYYFPVGGQDATLVALHLQHDAAIAITSATVEDTCFPEREVSDYASTAGLWIDEDPTTAFVGVVGATTTQTNGVVAVVAGNVGGAMWHVTTAARRTRLKVVVGATGGEVRVASWGKE